MSEGQTHRICVSVQAIQHLDRPQVPHLEEESVSALQAMTE